MLLPIIDTLAKQYSALLTKHTTRLLVSKIIRSMNFLPMIDIAKQ